MQPLCCGLCQDEGVSVPDLLMTVPRTPRGEVRATSHDERAVSDSDEGTRAADGIGEGRELGPLEERAVSLRAEAEEQGY